jgi:hypothetical protein
MARLPVALLAAALHAAAAAGQGISNLTISGNEVTASLNLPGVSADLTLDFEQVVGLTPANLGLTAQLVSPNDPSLLQRLPAGGLVTVPGLFPVLVRVQPPAAGGLSFNGMYTLGIHTPNLDLTPNCPLRLFSAEGGGTFTDITTAMGAGSYRVRGTGGSFSDFLIVADARPSATVIGLKLDAVDNLLATYGGAIPGPLLDSLNRQIQAARAYYGAGDYADAIASVDGFVSTVQTNSGSAIPNVWRASGDLTDVAGLLRAAAGTLRFSLSLASGAS